MTKIDYQLQDLNALFNTRRIKNKSSSSELTEQQFDSIIELIKQFKTDGQYEIDEDLILKLRNGTVIIFDIDFES